MKPSLESSSSSSFSSSSSRDPLAPLRSILAHWRELDATSDYEASHFPEGFLKARDFADQLAALLPDLEAALQRITEERDQLREFAWHKPDCALSKAQVPSFGCLFPEFFKHFGGQCAEKLEAKAGRCWWHCMLRAGHGGPHHGGPHHGSREKATDPPNVWDSGTCTCGLNAALAPRPEAPVAAARSQIAHLQEERVYHKLAAEVYRKGATKLLGEKRQAEEQLAALQQQIAQLRTSLQTLVERLIVVHADPRYHGVWTLFHAHGGRYDGPGYGDELRAAQKVLAEAVGEGSPHQDTTT